MGFLKAGRMDRRIRLLRAGAGSDDGYTTTPGADETLADAWAEVRSPPAPGAEKFANAETAAIQSLMFRIRWSPTVADLNAKDRVQYPIGGRTYDIKTVAEIGRREGLEIIGVARAD